MNNTPAPLRIAFVSDAIYPYNKGGKEKRLFEISKRLVKKGHEVHIYTMKWWSGPNVIRENGVYLHALTKLHPLYHEHRRSMSEAILFGLSTFKLLFASFDVIDVDSMPFFPLFSARIICWLRRKPMHATWHEVTDLPSWQSYIGHVPGLIAWGIERLSMRTANTLISVSAQTTSRLRASGIKRPIATVPLGVDLAEIYNLSPAAQKSDVIFVGSLRAHKNVDLLIRAIAIARVSHPAISTKIVGNGPEKIKLAGLIKDLHLEENVTLMGAIEKDNDLYRLMKASKMFVLPSIREGFSVVAIEANAAGIPIITTTHPDNAARELVTVGVNGYLVEPTAEAIADSILHVLNPKHTLQPTTNLDQYDWNRVAGNIEQVLTA